MYYNTKEASTPVNVSSKNLNGLSVNLLSTYEFKKSSKKKLEVILTRELKSKLSSQVKDATHVKKNISEKKSILEKVEMKYINDQISEELYQKNSYK